MSHGWRFRSLCRVLAALFLVTGLSQLVIAGSTLVDPLNAAASVDCSPCKIQRDPVRLLPTEETRIAAWQTAGSAERIEEHVGQRDVANQVFLAVVLRAVPFFVLFIGLASAVHGFGKKGFNFSSVRWLRRSALAGLVWVAMEPVALSLRMTALSPITHGRELNHIVIGGGAFFLALMIAGAVWVCVRIMEEALRLRSDLEEIV